MINNKPPELDCIMAVEAGGLFLFLQFCQDVPDAEFKCQFQLIAHQVPGIFSYSEIAAMGKACAAPIAFSNWGFNLGSVAISSGG